MAGPHFETQGNTRENTGAENNWKEAKRRTNNGIYKTSTQRCMDAGIFEAKKSSGIFRPAGRN